MGSQKFDFFFSEKSKLNFVLYWNHPSWVTISRTVVANLYINEKVYTSNAAWKLKKIDFLLKIVEIEF